MPLEYFSHTEYPPHVPLNETSVIKFKDLKPWREEAGFISDKLEAGDLILVSNARGETVGTARIEYKGRDNRGLFFILNRQIPNQNTQNLILKNHRKEALRKVTQALSKLPNFEHISEVHQTNDQDLEGPF